MRSLPSPSLSLSTLPTDIIRSIINLDGGDNLNSLRRISRSWNTLGSGYTGKIPSIDVIHMRVDSAYNVILEMIVQGRNFIRLRRILPKMQTSLPAYGRMSVIQWNCLDENNKRWPASYYIIRLFQRTILIKNLTICGANNSFEMLSHFEHVTINHLTLKFTQRSSSPNDSYFRECVLKSIRKNRVSDVELHIHKFYKIGICKLLLEISETVSTINFSGHCIDSESKVDERNAYWNAFARRLIEKKRITSLTILIEYPTNISNPTDIRLKSSL